ncbi:hypothetical protein KQX54_013583, partial [Cotesia glomerata]
MSSPHSSTLAPVISLPPPFGQGFSHPLHWLKGIPSCSEMGPFSKYGVDPECGLAEAVWELEKNKPKLFELFEKWVANAAKNFIRDMQKDFSRELENERLTNRKKKDRRKKEILKQISSAKRIRRLYPSMKE